MFTLPKLNYAYDSLEPYIDAKTMEIHHTKHHQTYVDKLNEIIEKAPVMASNSLDELVVIPETKNMAGGHANHTFWWKQIAPGSADKMPEELEKFKDEFNDKALKLFGSGWVWIAREIDSKELKVIQTPLQDSPLMQQCMPVLGIDLWEHAYYLKYQNRRAEYIEAFWNVVNWDFVNSNV